MPTPPGQGETVPFTAQELAEFEAKLDSNDLGDWAEIAKLKRLCALARKAAFVGAGGWGSGAGNVQIVGGGGFGTAYGGGGTFATRFGGVGVATDWSEVTRQLGERMAKIEADQTAILRRVSGPRVRLSEQAPEPTLSDAEKPEDADRMSFAEIGKSPGFKQMMAEADMRDAVGSVAAVNWLREGDRAGAAPVAGTARTSPVDESVSCYAMLVVNGRWPTRQEEQAWQVICVDGIVVKNAFGPRGKLSVVLGPEPGSFISFGLDYWERLWADHIPAPVPLSLEGCMVALTARREADQREAAVTFEAASQQTALALSMREQRDAAVSAMNQARAELGRWTREAIRLPETARIRDDDALQAQDEALAKQLNRINEALHCAVGTPLTDVVDRVLNSIRTASALEADEQRSRTDGYIDIVFDGPPSHESGRFVEVEDETGKSISVGEWIPPSPDAPPGEDRPKFWRLRVPRCLESKRGQRESAARPPYGLRADEALLTQLHRIREALRHPVGTSWAQIVDQVLGNIRTANEHDALVERCEALTQQVALETRGRVPFSDVAQARSERDAALAGLANVADALGTPRGDHVGQTADAAKGKIGELLRELELVRAERGLAWRDADDARAELKLAQKPGTIQQAISPLASEQILDDVIRAVMSSVDRQQQLQTTFEIKHRAADVDHPPRTELHVREPVTSTNEVSSNHVLAYVELGELRLAPVNPSGDYSKARVGNDYGWAWPARIRSALAGSKP